MSNNPKRKRSKTVERRPMPASALAPGQVPGMSTGKKVMLSMGAVGALVIGGGVMLGGSDEPYVRDQYASQEDCQADWGGDAGICEQVADRGTSPSGHSTSSSFHSSGTRTVWYGPSYPMNNRTGALQQAWSGKATPAGFVPGNRSIGRSTVSRGGFGSSSRSFSSSSSS